MEENDNRQIHSVRPTPLTPTYHNLLLTPPPSQMDGKEGFLASRRSRSPTLRRRITLQRYGFPKTFTEQWWLNANSCLGNGRKPEGAFVEAEPHLLAAGKRDSARVLAEMLVDWSAGANPGHFALHGILPYVPLVLQESTEGFA